ncbi:MAG: DUF58 domain-containing protein [Epsilonproteobacteria bacterium]|nr:DUF58 domain-containing protein [Campylobacterota bacterium]
MAGNNISHFEGEGFDFVELREYHFGDDVRKIDWKVTAKKQKPYIKIFKEEKELNVVIVSLLGGSVYFGSKVFKQDVIAEIFALLSFSSVKNSDNFSSLIFTDKEEKFLKPTKKIFGVYKGAQDILEFNPIGKKVDYKALVSYLSKRIKRKSIIFLVGDFVGDVDVSLLSKKHEVIAFVVRDKLEENPPDFGFINLMDPESKKFLQMDLSKKVVEDYKKSIIKNDAKLYKHFIKNRVRFTKIYTDDDPFVKISKLFAGV